MRKELERVVDLAGTVLGRTGRMHRLVGSHSNVSA